MSSCLAQEAGGRSTVFRGIAVITTSKDESVPEFSELKIQKE